LAVGPFSCLHKHLRRSPDGLCGPCRYRPVCRRLACVDHVCRDLVQALVQAPKGHRCPLLDVVRPYRRQAAKPVRHRERQPRRGASDRCRRSL
jgi:hypothetical protein